jgi:hypothetical protein
MTDSFAAFKRAHIVQKAKQFQASLIGVLASKAIALPKAPLPQTLVQPLDQVRTGDEFGPGGRDIEFGLQERCGHFIFSFVEGMN